MNKFRKQLTTGLTFPNHENWQHFKQGMYYSDTEACFVEENKCGVMKCLCWLADGSARAFVEEVHRRRGEADEEDAAESGRFSQREHQSHPFEY